MALLLVSYDLKKPLKKYPGLSKKIKKYSSLQLSDSSFAIITDKTPERVCEELAPLIGKKDAVYVINLKRPYDVHGSALSYDWLNKELTY
jgi:hypothetical protein